jgi:hypothetical protein
MKAAIYNISGPDIGVVGMANARRAFIVACVLNQVPTLSLLAMM